jgi:predicted  nucleic acid-binding Zn-ribbon protein
MSNIVTETIQCLKDLHRLEDQLSETKTGKAEIQSQLDAVRARLIPNILGHHDRMRARGKKSIAEVRNGVCFGCHMQVASGILSTVRRAEDIQLCAQCGRYLYIQEAPPAAAADPNAAAAPLADAPPADKPVKKKRAKKA